ncbi:MAG TPA: DUF1707 domain-containing protein [Trebonia sp.]
MPGTYGQQWTRYIHPGYSDQHMRVSDAERAEVADRLAAHYSDGRLDRAEFDERVARAMSAKTRADLNGLFDDLPDLEGHGAGDTGPAAGGGPGASGGVFGPTTPYRVGRRHRGNVHPILGIVLAVIIVSAAWHAFFHFFFIPWFLVLALIAAVVFARRVSGRTRQNR